ncbi:MAG: PAS domain S-box protein, partial [Nodosilinea sp.]
MLYWLARALLNQTGWDSLVDRSLSASPAPQRLIDAMPGIVFQADSDIAWSMRYLSAGCYQLTGYSPSELLSPDASVSYNTIVHPDDLPQVLATIQRAADAGQIYDAEYRIRTRSGEEKWVWEKGEGIVDSWGLVVGIEGFITDITPLKQSEAALRQVEQAIQTRSDLLELVLNNIPQPLFWKDSQGYYLGCNQAFARAMGLATPADIVGGVDSDLFCLEAEEADYRAARDRLVVSRGLADLHAIEPRIYTNGQLGWVDYSRLPIRNLEGTVVGVLCTFEDITKQLINQQTLRRREQILATLAEIQRQLLAWQWGWQERPIVEMFAILGELSGASRVYYYEVKGGYDQQKQTSLVQRIEWLAPGVPPTAATPRFQTVVVQPIFADWYSRLNQRQTINLVEADFSDLQRQVLTRPPSCVKSLLLLPLMIQNQLRGVIGFNNCTTPRLWNDAEIDLLRVVTADLALALERRQSELSLKRAEAKYRSIFENAVEGMFQSTALGYYLTVNPTLARIYGYHSPQDLIQNLTDINQQLYVQPGRRQEFASLIGTSGSVLGFESEVYRKDGAVIWISESARAIYNDRQVLVGYEGTVEDITDRKRREAAILRRDRLLQGVAEASQCLLKIADVHQAIPQVLACLGEAATADRAYVCTHHSQSETGEPATTLRYEWTSAAIAPSVNQLHWQDQSYHSLGLERWYSLFLEGQSICALTRHLPQAEQDLLSKDDILSLLMVPIFVDANLWGYIGFDARQPEWEWNA